MSSQVAPASVLSFPNASYTLEDHQTWSILVNECMNKARNLAHPDCLLGLEKLGLLTGTIPSIDTINERLLKYGWQVIPVFGFMPPKEYLSFVAKKCLPVAINIRTQKLLEFNPEPDIFHEAFGHLSLLVNSDFSNFLQQWALASLFAFQTPGEETYYQNIRERAKNLSIEQTDLRNTTEQNVSLNSEATKLARLGWWTVECGLIKIENEFKIFGAAILSSVRECSQIQSDTPKIRLSESALNHAFDPTRVQPSYYFIESFNELTALLESVSSSMAFRIGGSQALEIAKQTSQPAIIKFESGKISNGVVIDFTNDELGQPRTISLSVSGRLDILEISKNDRIISVIPSDCETYL
jgi:phenylalanine-4-hydroxylase